MMGLLPLSMKGPPWKKPDCRIRIYILLLIFPSPVGSVPSLYPLTIRSECMAEHASWTASTKRPEVPHTSPRRSAISSSVRILFSIVSLLFYSVFLTPSESFADPFRDFILYSYQTPEQGEVSVGTGRHCFFRTRPRILFMGRMSIHRLDKVT